jgi:hypothetical protein
VVVDTKDAEHYEQELIILTWINSNIKAENATANDVVREWQRRLAMIFDVETSISKGLYIKMGEIGRNLIDELRIDTNN